MADPILPNPLTEDHYQQIKNALTVIEQAQVHIDLAKRAGVDVSDSERQMQESRTKLLQLKNVYFPGR